MAKLSTEVVRYPLLTYFSMRGFRGVCLSPYGDKNVKIVFNDEFVSVKLDEGIFLMVSSDRLHLKGWQ